MRLPSIIDWLQILAVLGVVQIFISGLTVICLYRLFTRHDGSVLEKLDEFIQLMARR